MLEDNASWVSEKGVWEFVRGRQERFHVVDARRRKVGARKEFRMIGQMP